MRKTEQTTKDSEGEKRTMTTHTSGTRKEWVAARLALLRRRRS